jgi:Flp pilus assembly protein TadB
MTGGTWPVALLLLAAAALVAWPLRSLRARRRSVLAPPRRTAAGADDPLVDWVTELGRGLDGPPDALDSSPGRDSGSALPAGLPRGGPTAASTAGDPPSIDAAGRRSPLTWSTRDLATGAAWPPSTGGAPGSTRPAGPSRPPTRRDGRRPAGNAEPPTGHLDPAQSLTAVPGATGTIAGRHAGLPDGAIRRAAGHLQAGRPGGVVGSDPVHPQGIGQARVVAAAVRVEAPEARWRRDGGAGAAATDDRPRWLGRHPVPSVRQVLLLVAVAGAGVGAVLAGPVAAVVLSGYGTLGVRALLRGRANRQAERARRRALDQLCGLAADLRAGLPVPPAVEIAPDGAADGSDRLRRLTSAAVRLADRTGAPLAELVERIEADARATDRGLAGAAAQAAGARATALLLAALPVGGIGLGYGIGVDPMAVLLDTTIGGVCAVLAVALQAAGLLWAERLGAAPGRAG